jgi:acyl-CoA thioester hydrolase
LARWSDLRAQKERQKPYPCHTIHGIDTDVSNLPEHLFAIAIDPADIDFMGHVNNASYLKWVQDAVIDHWRAFAPAQAIADHVWVATNHNITYRRPTFLEDKVIAHVILERVQGARAFYETIIKRGEEVLAEVKSSWCCLDATTLRPSRLARDLVEKFLPSA